MRTTTRWSPFGSPTLRRWKRWGPAFQSLSGKSDVRDFRAYLSYCTTHTTHDIARGAMIKLSGIKRTDVGTIDVEDVIAALPEEERAWIEARAAELLAEQATLQDL